MKPKVGILYYSMTGNTFLMARAVAQGVEEASGQPEIRTVPELLPEATIEADERVRKARHIQKDVTIAKVEELSDWNGMIIGSPTRFGNMCSQMRNFLDQTGGLWAKGSLIGKPAGVFCCTGSLHGGQETTLISMMFTLLHHGAVLTGVPYSTRELVETKSGGTPYGPTAVVGPKADREPTESDLSIARELGRRVTRLAAKMKQP